MTCSPSCSCSSCGGAQPCTAALSPLRLRARSGSSGNGAGSGSGLASRDCEYFQRAVRGLSGTAGGGAPSTNTPIVGEDGSVYVPDDGSTGGDATGGDGAIDIPDGSLPGTTSPDTTTPTGSGGAVAGDPLAAMDGAALLKGAAIGAFGLLGLRMIYAAVSQ